MKSIEIGKHYDRTKPEKLLIMKLKNIIIDFLDRIKNRKGINGFKLLDINIEFEKILVHLNIHMDYRDSVVYNMTIEIPYTSRNYGLR